MRKHLGVGGLLALASVLWVACDGEQFLAVEGPYRDACDSQAECENGESPLGLECIRRTCECPREGDVLCCARKESPCDRHCRPAVECAVPAQGHECQTAADCTGKLHPDTRCATAACVDNKCELRIRGTSPTQRTGDCTVITCDVDGRSREREATKDVYDDNNQCTLDRCDGTEVINEPLEAGRAPDGSGYCDGRGHRVECLTTEHCGNPSYACSKSGVCVLQWCADDNFDESLGETAIDCGGPCDDCAAGQTCSFPSDCKDGICASTGKCALPECDDQTQNGAEAGFDCGGPSCPRCSPGASCRIHDDCESGVCRAGVCLFPACDDGVMNGSETDVDHGGPCTSHPNSTEPSDAPPRNESM